MIETYRADEYFKYAKSYACAAERLLDSLLLDTELAPAFYLLIAHSLELSLKALCLNAGVTEKKLRNFGKTGHDLHAAYTCAMQHGKVPNYMTPLGRLVLALRNDHNIFAFRFPPNKSEIIVPPPEHCIQVLNDHISSVEKILRITSANGLP